MGSFDAEVVAFVQTPQTYHNRCENRPAGARTTTGPFYGPIMRGRKARRGRVRLWHQRGIPPGGPRADRRSSRGLDHRGPEGLAAAAQGWLPGEYVSKVLASGMGPVDVGGYFSQQFRWARGGLEILFHRLPFFSGCGGRHAVSTA